MKRQEDTRANGHRRVQTGNQRVAFASPPRVNATCTHGHIVEPKAMDVAEGHKGTRAQRTDTRNCAIAARPERLVQVYQTRSLLRLVNPPCLLVYWIRIGLTRAGEVNYATFIIRGQRTKQGR